MTTTLVLVYLAGVFADLKVVLVMLSIVGSAAWGGVAAAAIVEGAEEFWPTLRRTAPWLIASVVLAIALPSKTLLYMAAGLQAGQEIAQTDVAQKALTLLNKRLDEMLAE